MLLSASVLLISLCIFSFAIAAPGDTTGLQGYCWGERPLPGPRPWPAPTISGPVSRADCTRIIAQVRFWDNYTIPFDWENQRKEFKRGKCSIHVKRVRLKAFGHFTYKDVIDATEDVFDKCDPLPGYGGWRHVELMDGRFDLWVQGIKEKDEGMPKELVVN